MGLTFNFDTALPHQLEFLESQSYTTALVTGYGGGKSYAGVIKALILSQINEGCPGMIVSPSYVIAGKTVIESMYEVFDLFDPKLVEGKDFKYNQTKHLFTFYRWNNKIWIGSADIPKSLKGPNLSFAILDEPGLFDKEAYDVMISRVRHPKAKRLSLDLTGTPEGLNWFYDICEGELKPSDFKLVRGRTTDNIFLPQKFIDNLYDQYDELLVDAYINGIFVNMASGSAYYSYKTNLDDTTDQNETNDLLYKFEPIQSKPLLIGMDFNYDPFSIVIGQEHKRDLIIFDEYFLRNCDTNLACERIVDKYGSSWEYHIYPDPACKARSAHGAGKTDLSLIREGFKGYDYYIHAKSSHSKRKDRLNSVNGKLCNGKKERHCFITKKCKNLKNDLKKVTMEEYLNGNFKDKSLGHISDAFGYLVDYRYPIRAHKTGEQYIKENI